MRTQAEYELEVLKVLTSNGFSLEECAYVLKDLSNDVSLAEAMARVIYQRKIEKEKYEELTDDVFNDPIAF